MRGLRQRIERLESDGGAGRIVFIIMGARSAGGLDALDPEEREKAKEQDRQSLHSGLHVLQYDWPDADLLEMMPPFMRRQWLAQQTRRPCSGP